MTYRTSRYRRPDGTLPPMAGGDPTLDASLKDRLKKVEDEISGLRDERVQAAKEREAAKQAVAGITDLSSDSQEFKDAQDAVRKVGEIDDKITEKQAVQVGILKMLGPDADPTRRDNGATRRDKGDGEHPREWNSKTLFDSEELQGALRHAATSKSRFGGIEIGEVASRDVMKADIGGTASMRLSTYGGIIPQIYRPLRVLDLLSTGTIDGNNLPYTQEGGTFNAVETAEGAAKPEGGLTFTDATAPVQTIAAWQKILKQALEDFAAIQSIIDGRLRYSVLRRLEAQVLNGNGTGSNLRGILQTSGIISVAYSATPPVNELVLAGVTQVYLADAEASGIVLHPSDWQSMLVGKAAGSGEYFSGGPFSVTPQMMWGVPCLPSPAIPQGTALVGDFAIGAQLLIRSGVNVLLSDSDQDDFIKNKVTMLGEMRAALPVWRPAAFAKVALA